MPLGALMTREVQLPELISRKDDAYSTNRILDGRVSVTRDLA